MPFGLHGRRTFMTLMCFFRPSILWQLFRTTTAAAHASCRHRKVLATTTTRGRWIFFPTLTGTPATVAPVGLTPAGLPCGVQITGPFLEDGTTIAFAALLKERL